MKRTIKSIFAVLVLLILSLSLFACTNESGGNIGIGKNEDVELAETIALNISSNNISKASTLSNELQNPNAECKKIVMEALCDRINSKANTYLTSFASKNELVDEQVISEFRLYENIVNNIGITDTDNTNIQSYISGFLGAVFR